jgi:hypothetical protein
MTFFLDFKAAPLPLMAFAARADRGTHEPAHQTFECVAHLDMFGGRGRERTAMTPDDVAPVFLQDLSKPPQLVEERADSRDAAPKRPGRRCPSGQGLARFTQGGVELARGEPGCEHIQQLGEQGDIGTRKQEFRMLGYPIQPGRLARARPAPPLLYQIVGQQGSKLSPDSGSSDA